MSPFVCYVAVATFAMFAILLPLASTTSLGEAIEPVIALDGMRSDHACDFICTMCFTDVEDEDKLMACTNTVCKSLVEGQCAFEKFIWLGHHCRHYEMVEMMWSVAKRKRSAGGRFSMA